MKKYRITEQIVLTLPFIGDIGLFEKTVEIRVRKKKKSDYLNTKQ